MGKVSLSKTILLGSSLFFLLSCSSGSTFKKPIYVMDTEITCKAKTKNESELQEVLAPFEEVDSYSDANNPRSRTGIYEINASSSPVAIGEGLYELLSFALEMEEVTKGYFNPLCFGLASLWKDSLLPKEEGSSPFLPEEEDIQKEVAKIANTSLKLEKNGDAYTASLEAKDPSIGRASLDLGGIAKGYAAKKAKEKAESLGWQCYYINGGNSTMVLGEAESNGGYYTLSWGKDVPNKKMRLKNTCLSTSSVTEQGTEINGKTYSHLVNPFTGEASPSITGVTLVGQDPAILDAFSTAFMWMKEEDRLALENQYGIKAVYYKDGEVLRDSIGLEKA